MPPPGPSLADRLVAHWYRPRPSLASRLLQPLSWLYAALAAQAARRGRQHRSAWHPRPPVIVVGNLIVGGAGKTPTVIALVRALQQAGLQPGVVSRGYGRQADELAEVTPASDAAAVGDEPLLIARRTGAAVQVGRNRVAAARALLARRPEVDVIVCDDGLQHAALPRDAEVLVFDERGIGNGLLLPAGPLRQRFPDAPSELQQVLYNAEVPSTPWPGRCVTRRLGHAVPLADWQRGIGSNGRPLAALRGRRVIAAAGVAAPERFFRMLESEGLTIERLPLPDHFDFRGWAPPAGSADVLVTEKDAVKLDAALAEGGRIGVVGLDFALPDDFVAALLRSIGRPAA